MRKPARPSGALPHLPSLLPGILFSLPPAVSLFLIRRTGTCPDCGKCGKAGPSRVAGRDDPKRECCLCGRCTEVCPVKTGVASSR